MVRFSQLVVEHPWIKEIDINPLLASSDRLLALDARVVIYGLDKKEEDLPKAAIRPYPMQYVQSWKMKDGTPITVRPIRPEDEPSLITFHEKLSERTVLMRYFTPMGLGQRTAHERLTRICFVNYDRDMALVAERKANGTSEVLAVSRLTRLHGTDMAEATVVVLDEAQHMGLGTELMKRTIEVARAEKLKQVVATMLAENEDMLAICKKLGFKIAKVEGRDLLRAELAL
jgi:acetyltransferase